MAMFLGEQLEGSAGASWGASADPAAVSLGSENRGDLAKASVRLGELDNSRDRGLLTRLELQPLRPLGRQRGPGAAANEFALELAEYISRIRRSIVASGESPSLAPT